ncbi:5-oxoproline transporter, DUF979 family subunit [Streptomyces sp. NPDC060030]|uniref:5-oxoproline transporter, DUF979 family subunit n=1 Tax=Streptomyces sp. NPDC060030 TaxID=3347042 RepID=UPI0036983DDF
MIKSEYFFWLVGAVFLVMAAQMAMDRTNPKRFGSAAFWGLLGAAFFYSTGVVDTSLPAEPLGVAVLVLIVLGGFGLTGKGESHTPPREKRAASAACFGNKLFLPALTIPVVAMICATLVKNWKIGGEPVLEPGYETILGLGVGAIAALAVGMVLLRERKLSVPLHSGRNMLESMGWALLLPQLLSVLGSIFQTAGVGDQVGRITEAVLPDGQRLVAVAVYCCGIGHLLGLTLSRAAALRTIAGALPDGPARDALLASAEAHLARGLPTVSSGDFSSDHWLATYAALALDTAPGH